MQLCCISADGSRKYVEGAFWAAIELDGYPEHILQKATVQVWNKDGENWAYQGEAPAAEFQAQVLEQTKPKRAHVDTFIGGAVPHRLPVVRHHQVYNAGHIFGHAQSPQSLSVARPLRQARLPPLFLLNPKPASRPQVGAAVTHNRLHAAGSPAI